MGIAAIYGLPGKGKSSFATYYAFYLANKYEKKIVSNFLFNPLKLALYCKLMGYKWLSENLHKDIIYFIPSNSDLASILSIPDSIILLDEAAIWLPARGSTHSTPKKLLEDLCQIRHESQYLLFIAQSERQVDVALRALTEQIYWANGMSLWCKKLRNEKLVYKTVRQFTVDAFEQFMSDPKLRKNPLKAKILATKTWDGFLTASDKFIFSLYDSFNRLESQQLNNNSSLLKYYSPDIPLFPPPEKKEFPRIRGNNPFKPHKFSDLITFLFNKLPAASLSAILKLDKRLASYQSFNSLERKIVLFIFGYLLFMFVGIILP